MLETGICEGADNDPVFDSQSGNQRGKRLDNLVLFQVDDYSQCWKARSQLFKRRDGESPATKSKPPTGPVPVSGVQLTDLAAGQSREVAIPIGRAIDGVVVETEDDAVGRHVHIGLDMLDPEVYRICE